MGGCLSRSRLRRLLPDALLLRGPRLEERVGLVTGEDGRILGLAAEKEEASSHWERFPGEIWSAAPVLAHAHLDAWDAPTGSFRRSSFAEWVRDLLAWREEGVGLSSAASAKAASMRLADAGCARVGTHVGAREALPLPGAPLALHAWREVLDPFPSDGAEASFRRWSRAAPPCDGLALHAPYSVGLDLAREVFARAGGVVSVHLGESDEERACLADGSGPLAELLAERRGRRPVGGFSSPLAWLAAAGGLRGSTLAVHATALNEEELHALARAGVAIVFCPGTHLWFGRAAPRFAAAGVFPTALGCDSRASNEDLDPLREFRLALQLLPSWTAESAWQALTEGGAQALGRPQEGRLEVGSPARFLRFRDARATDAVHRETKPERRAAAWLRWLASCEDPTLGGTQVPDPVHAISG